MRLFASVTGEVPDESPKVEVKLGSRVSFYAVLAIQTLVMFVTSILTVQMIYPPALIVVVCLALFFAGTSFVNYHFGQAGFSLVAGLLGALSLGTNELSWHAPVFATLVIVALRSHFLLSSVDKKYVIDRSVLAYELKLLCAIAAGLWAVWGVTWVLGGAGSGVPSLAIIACGIAVLLAAFVIAYTHTKDK